MSAASDLADRGDPNGRFWTRARVILSEGFCPTCHGRLMPAPMFVPDDASGGLCTECSRISWARNRLPVVE